MKSSYIKFLCLSLVITIPTLFFTACGNSNKDNNSSSSLSSSASSSAASTAGSIIVSPSRTDSAEATSRDTLSDSDIEFLKKLFACMTTADFSSKYSLNDQICMQFIENIINYQDTTGDKFFIDITADSNGNYTMDKTTAENICKDLLNYTLLHDSDYLMGESYFFPTAGGVVPVVEITKTSTIGVMFQIYYTTKVGDNAAVNHIASVTRNDSDVTPFRFQSLTINS